MTGYTRLETVDEDVLRVLVGIARNALVRRGLHEVAAALDRPRAVLRLEVDDEDSTIVYVGTVKATVVPRAHLEHAVGLARLGRDGAN